MACDYRLYTQEVEAAGRNFKGHLWPWAYKDPISVIIIITIIIIIISVTTMMI